MSKTNQPLEILGTEILPGKGAQLNLHVARLHTHTPVQVPVIVQRAKKPGPCVLLMAGSHGDEINGVEIVRKMIHSGLNKPDTGTIICIPVFNIFGFLNLTRELPDGRDLNRSFPGTKNGSLASQFAYHFMQEIAPHVDVVLDFHTGGAQRNNAPQIRIVPDDTPSFEMAKVFNAPFIVGSKLIPKSIREAFAKLDVPFLLYEGGTTQRIEQNVVQTGINGAVRVLEYLGVKTPSEQLQMIEPSKLLINNRWLRAPQSGMFELAVANEAFVQRGDVLGYVRDPFGKREKPIKAPESAYIFCVNESPVVNKGDAIFHIGQEGKGEKSFRNQHQQ